MSVLPAGLHKKLSTGGTPSKSIDMDMYIENIPQSTLSLERLTNPFTANVYQA